MRSFSSTALATRFALIAALASAVLAQPPSPFDRPPAGVDQALRERIKQFYQYHVTGEFRKAEGFVAEDTQDFFYSHNKPRYLSFEIKSIQYSDNYTKAKAVVVCEQYVPMPGFGDKPFQVPTPSTWKIENEKWMWWVDPATVGQSPFGTMKPGPMKQGAPSLGPSAAAIAQNPNFLFTQVKLDRDAVSLKPGESAQVTIANGAPGPMTVTIAEKLAGVEASLDKTDLQAGEKAILTVKAGKDATPGALTLLVDQTGQRLPVQIFVPAKPGDPELTQIKLDKDAVSLKPGESAQVTIVNTGHGPMIVAIAGKVAGVEASLDQTGLQPGGRAILTVKAGKDAKSGLLTLLVEQTRQLLPVQITVKPLE
jgi:hypothetical protein